MIIYEVNIAVDKSICSEYKIWLIEHIKEILSIDGFTNAILLNEINNSIEDNKIHFTVQYQLKSYDALENYLTHHALQLRQQSVDKFGNQFSITRRIFEIEKNFNF